MQNYFFEKRPQALATEEGGWQLPAPQTPERSWRRRDRLRPLILFFIFLAVIAGVTAALTLHPAGDLDALATPPAGASASPAPSSQETPPPVERAPLGGGAAMTIAPLPTGAPHSFQQIYQENISSIVSVRGYQAGGMSLGTGVVLSEDGYIVTNAHVIEGCFQLEVILWDEQACKALLVGQDAETDLAVLKIDAGGLVPAVFGDSDLLQVGDVALAIGNPLGEDLKGTMTDGIISAISRDVSVDGRTMTLIQTTAALNSGNSGGALINAYGQVVGITNLKMQSYYNTVEGLGFAIPTTTTKRIVDELIEHGVVTGRPTIGVTVRSLTEAMAEQYEVPLGVRVEAVEKKSDAWAKGVRPGDVIVEANGSTIRTTEDLLAAKSDLGAGDVLLLRIYRGGEYLNISVCLVEQYTLDS